MIQINNEIICFGGSSGLGKKLKDFWSFNLDTRKWSKMSAMGETPSPRDGHCCGVLYNKYIFIYGGIDEDDNSLSDINIFDIEGHTW